MSNRYRSPEMLAADHDVPGFECRSREQYDHTCRATPVMIHKTNILERNATAPPGTRIITAIGQVNCPGRTGSRDEQGLHSSSRCLMCAGRPLLGKALSGRLSVARV